MKRQDTASNKLRILKNLRKNSNWSILVENGSIENLIDVIAESENELSRYLEYLLNEKKWDNAMNIESLTSLGALISRKVGRSRAAYGYVIVSHTDDNGVNRLANYGSKFFNVNEDSNFDDLTENKDCTYAEKYSLTPWTCSDVYTVPRLTKFIANDGTEFISVVDKSISKMSDPYSSVLNDSLLLQNFNLSGGWESKKYLKIPVVQGIIKQESLGVATGQRYDSFVITNPKVEAADTLLTQGFFKVMVDGEEWSEVINISMAEPYDKVYETKLLEDQSGVLIKFGDGINGRLLKAGATVTCQYLETKGEAGNLNSIGKITSMKLPSGLKMVDPRTHVESNFLSCTNIYPIQGGTDIEDVYDYKKNAPQSYLESYTSGTIKEYLKKIPKFSPVKLLNYSVSAINENSVVDINNFNSKEVSQQLIYSKNAIGITALDSSGNIIENADVAFIEPLYMNMSEIMSPGDSFSYVEPNLVKLHASINASIEDKNVTESDAKNELKAAVLSKFGVDAQNFNNTIYSSEVTSTVNLFEYLKNADVDILAIANVDYDEVDYIDSSDASNNTSNSFAIIPFEFSDVFLENEALKGLKNHKNEQHYILRADINFINGWKGTDKTLIIKDNRSTDISIEDAKQLYINGENEEPFLPKYELETANGYHINFFDESSTQVLTQVCRVSQYNYFEEDITSENINAILSQSQYPYENFRLTYDQSSNTFKQFNADDIEDSSLKYSKGSSSLVYKLNKNFTDYIDIQFNEGDGGTLDGIIVLPISYLGFSSELNKVSTTTKLKNRLKNLLKEYVRISIKGVPKQTSFQSLNWNDIIFFDKDSISVKVSY